MYAKVTLLLLGFAVAAYGETCNCSRLKACIDEKKDVLQRITNKCAARCQDRLPDNADKVQKCMKEKNDALEQLKDDQMDCLLNPTGGTCVAPRARRQTNKNNFFVQPSAADFQPASNQGRWIQAGAQAQTQTQTGASVKVDGDQVLQPYYDCVHKCVKEVRPEKGEGMASGMTQGAVDQLGRHLAAIQECQTAEKCTVDVPSLVQAAQTCQTDRADVLSSKKNISQNFCKCMRDALNKSDTEMPCLPDANGGRSKGGRSG
jgi:hypothetical protein